MADSAAVVLTDSIGRLSRSLDSLRDVVKTMAVQHDSWLHTLQGQTALYLAVTAVLVAIATAFSWVAGRAEIRHITEEEFVSLSKRLEDKFSLLVNEMLRNYGELKGASEVTMAALCETNKDWTEAVAFFIDSAILAASSERWSESVARIESAERILNVHSTEVRLTVKDVAGFRQEFTMVKDTAESMPVRLRLEALLVRIDNAVVSLGEAANGRA